jgi:hypothetical protein
VELLEPHHQVARVPLRHHEVYEAEAKYWENMYANFQPMGLSATSYLRADGKLEGCEVADEWISPLLPAIKGKLSTSLGQLGWGKGDENESMGRTCTRVGRTALIAI